MRRGMHFGDGGIVRLVNVCGVGIAMELELMGEPIDAQRAKECHLVNRVVARDQLMATAEEIAAKILRNPRAAVESAKETILDVAGRPLDDQLRIECLNSHGRPGDRGQARRVPRPRRPGPGHHVTTGVTTDGVRFGINLMPPRWAGEPPETGPALLARRRRLLGLMADAGMDHVMVGDHVMFHGGLGNDGLVDAASTLTATDLDLYLSVYLLVLRHPLLVARQLVTLAQLFPGRVSVGLGIAGDDRNEVEACGVDPSTRGRRMDESLGLLRRLLAGEEVTHDGEFFRLDRAHVVPTPDAPIPLVVGGRAEAALRRAGRLGDGWLGIWTSAERCARSIATVEQYAADAGRTEADWNHGMTFWCGFGPDRDRARSHVAPVMEGFYRVPFDKFERYIPHGTVDDVAEFVAPFISAGATTVNIIPFAEDVDTAIGAVADVVKLLRATPRARTAEEAR
jgi:alkanesulfonate monooxygenase SsuD/methylene tetrahydromethanopterin reductase-like flavin-dependent oxidoreductase (luciferase family)